MVGSNYPQESIACRDDVPGVYSATYAIPLVCGYDTDGTIGWVSRLSDTEPQPLEQGYNDGNPSERYLEGLSDSIYLRTLTSGGYLIAQVIRLGRDQAAQDRDDLGTHTFVSSTTSGEGLRG